MPLVQINGYFYLGTPYSKDPEGLEAAHRKACEQAALFYQRGYPVYSPIAHCHPIATYGKLSPTNTLPWGEFDRIMLLRSIGMVVCKLPGWEESEGLRAKIKLTEEQNLPLYFMTPGYFPFYDPDPFIPGESR